MTQKIEKNKIFVYVPAEGAEKKYSTARADGFSLTKKEIRDIV